MTVLFLLPSFVPFELHFFCWASAKGMGRGAKGQWFKCKEDAKPHATMPTTRTERTPKDMPCNFLFCGELQLLRIRRVVYRAKERPLCRLDRQRATLFIAGSSKTELSLDSALELTLLGNYSCLSSPDPFRPNPSIPDFVPFESPSSRHSWKPVGGAHMRRMCQGNTGGTGGTWGIENHSAYAASQAVILSLQFALSHCPMPHAPCSMPHAPCPMSLPHQTELSRLWHWFCASCSCVCASFAPIATMQLPLNFTQLSALADVMPVYTNNLIV